MGRVSSLTCCGSCGALALALLAIGQLDRRSPSAGGFVGGRRLLGPRRPSPRLQRWHLLAQGDPGTPQLERPPVKEAEPQRLQLQKQPRRQGGERQLATKESSRQPASWLATKPRPATLPATLFEPKRSLKQSFIADPNYVRKIATEVRDDSPGGRRVVELGPGTGAVTKRLHRRFPEMITVELDKRAIRELSAEIPGVTCVRSDALLVNYTRIAEIRGGPLTIVGNLPFHASTQLLFTLCDHAESIKTATITLQKEVARRIVSKPRRRSYGIPSIAFQLYADCRILFDVPAKAYIPRPEVETCVVRLDFESARERRLTMDVDPRDLRNVTKTAFHLRNRMLKNSLKRLLCAHDTLIDELPEDYRRNRARDLDPWEYVYLTHLLYGRKKYPEHLWRAWRGQFKRTVSKKERKERSWAQPGLLLEE